MPVDLGNFNQNIAFDLPDLSTMPLKQPDPQPDIIDEEEFEMVRCAQISVNIEHRFQ